MAIQMTRAEYEAKYGVQAPVSGIQNKPVVNNPTTPIKMTRAEYDAKYGKQNLQSQGLPTSARRDRTQPTLVGGIIRDIVKQPIKAVLSVARPFVDPLGKKGGLSVNTKYLGNVGDYGTEIEKSTTNLANKYKAGEISLGRAAIGGAGAGALQAMDFAAVAPVGKVASQAVKGTVKQALVPTLKTAAKESLIRGGAVGAGYDVSSQLASGEKYNPLQTVAAGAVGTVADLGLSYGLPKALNKGKEVIIKTPEQRSMGVDKDIRNIFNGTTGDVAKINDSAFRARKGLELLQKESKNISIPDESAPLGSNLTKKFDITKAKPNEILSAVKEQDNLITSRARKAVENARSQGLSIDTNEATGIINQAEQSGQVTKAMAERVRNQISDIGNDPVKAHDWVQEVNTRFKKKYERGTIDDTVLGKLADDVADVLRTNLDNVIDRKGYAEAYGNNQELKRMLLAIAKKANRSVSFGDITTDAGLDLGISILTGNPAYMARTIGSGLFKGIVSKFRNNAGLRSFRSAVKGTAKLPTKTRLPFSVAKPQFKTKNLLPEGKGFENKAGIQLGKPKTPTTFEPRAKVVGYSNNDGNLNQRYNSTATASKTGISKVSRETPKKSITKQVVKTEPKIVKSKTLPTKNVEVITSVGDKKFTIKSPERIYNKGTRIVGEYNGKEYITNSLILEFKNDTGLTHDFAKTPKGPDSDAIQTLINKSKTGSKDIGKPVSMGDSGGGDKVFIFKDGTAVNPDYYNYVAKKYPNLKLEHNGTIGAIIVSSDDKMVGLLMPYNKIVENKNIVPIENVVKPTKRIISEESYKKASATAKSPRLGLPEPKAGLPKSQNFVPIELPGVKEPVYRSPRIAGNTTQYTNIPNTKPKNIDIPTQLPKSKVMSSDLSTEAKKYKSAEEFVKAFTQDIKRGQYWHITEDPNFKIDINKGPRDMSSLAAGEIDKGKLMITSDLPYWAENYKGTRKYVAKIDMKDVSNSDFFQTERGMGNEFFIKNPKNARVTKVVPIDAALKESKAFKSWLEKNINSKEDLLNIWNKANKKVAVELPTGLVQQAKKYKSAEEFVKAQGKTIYHGTNTDFDITKAISGKRGMFGEGVYFSGKKEGVVNAKITKEAVLPNSAKVFETDLTKISKYLDEQGFTGEKPPFMTGTGGKEFSDFMKSKGYDAIVLKNLGKETTVVLNPSILKEKSQLTDIWNKTNKKVTLPKSSDLSTGVNKVAYHGTQAKQIVGTPNATDGSMGKAFYVTDNKGKAEVFGKEKNVLNQVITNNKGKKVKQYARESGYYKTSNVFDINLDGLNIKEFKDSNEFFKYISNSSKKDIPDWFKLSGYDGAYIKDSGTYAIYSPEKIKMPIGNQGVSLAKNTTEDLVQQAKKYKSAEEFVKSQPTVYRGEGGSNVAQGKALLAEGKHYASDAEYPKGFGKVEEYVLKPKAKVLDLGDSTFAEISQKLGIPERNYISPKELASIAKEKGYDVVKYTGEYKSTGKQFIHTVDLTGDSYITKSQLTDIWNKANNK